MNSFAAIEPWRVASLKKRLEAKTYRTEGCWEWAGLIRGGYGVITLTTGLYQGVQIGTHRVSWMLHNGDIPEGLQICHRCDKPTCINPEHLFLGTHTENHADKCQKKRWRTTSDYNSSSGEWHYLASITSEIALNIVELRKRGLTYKQIAAELGVTYYVARDVALGISWYEVTGLPHYRRLKYSKGNASTKSRGLRINADTARAIVRLDRQGLTNQKIADALSVSLNVVRDVVIGKSLNAATGLSHHRKAYP